MRFAGPGLCCTVALLALSLASRGICGPVEESPFLPLRGEITSTRVQPSETLLDVAYRQRLGFRPLTRLNPHVDPWIPSDQGRIHLPTRYILPTAAPEGLVINIPEMRLYDFTRGPDPEVFAIAVGTAENPTPLGTFAIGVKQVDPVWYVPESIRREAPGLPAAMPAGRDNPLGRRWMTLGTTAYGIHGTNSRWSVGRTTTHGCVRLYEDQMWELFERTAPGTPVQIIYQTLKWGRDGDLLYLEAHPDLYARQDDPLRRARAEVEASGLGTAVDLDRVAAALTRPIGVPVMVGRTLGSAPVDLARADPEQ